jgi:hypothetical protein
MLSPIAGELPPCAPFVGGVHQSGAAARDHAEARVRKQTRDDLGLLVVRMAGLDPRAAEHAYGRSNAAQPLSRDRELCHNSQHAPRFLAIGRVECGGIDELRNLVGLTHAYARVG